LLGKIKSQSNELKQIRQTLDGLSQHNKNVYQASYERALVDLRAQKVAAVNDGDGSRVVQLDDAIAQTREAIQAVKNTPVAAAQPKGQSQEFTDFLEEFPLYNRDEDAKAWSHGIAIKYAQEHSDATEKQVYDEIVRRAKTRYPAQRKGPPSPDGEGRSSGGSTSKDGGSKAFDALMATLDETAVKVARDFIKRGVMTKEKYVQDYETMGRN
jgi:hypothetical protein